MLNKEHNEHCERIVKDLQAYYNGLVVKDLNTDEELTLTSEELEALEDEKIEGVNYEVLSLYDYFNGDSIYNINYILDSNKELEAVRIMVACGGPNIYINTWDRKVELRWWSENGEAYIDNELCEAINDVFNEYFNC